MQHGQISSSIHLLAAVDPQTETCATSLHSLSLSLHRTYLTEAEHYITGAVSAL
jgi:hypothetical protein